MKRKVEVIAYHGWGMNAQFWNEWDELFGEHVIFKKNDRGYFSKPINHHFKEKDAVRLLFVQGFGMHWVSKADWQNAHLIVLFSAFNNLKEIISRKNTVDHVVQKLQEQIEHKPYHTLELFWDEMFKSGEKIVNMSEFDIHDKDLLENDLNAYYQNLVDFIPIRDKAKVILYETEYDKISNFSQAQVMKKLFGRLDYFKTFNFMGHAYPFNKAKECYHDLESHLKIFE